MHEETTARLLIRCPDKPGIVAAVSGFLYNHGANINTLDEYTTDPDGGEFFMRLEFQTPHLDLSRSVLERSFNETVAERYEMDWRISYAAKKQRTALFVSKMDHALVELLWRWSRGKLPADIVMVISNHDRLRETVNGFGVPFHHVPVTPETKQEAEAEMTRLMGDDIDLMVLARYMQILTRPMVDKYRNRIINIHHSFLPAFVGANPYRRAHDRGVKLIGATAHYVTDNLDEGPIIEQDVLRVSHAHTVSELIEMGQNIERHVLARAVKWHLEDRTIVHGNKTIVFQK